MAIDPQAERKHRENLRQRDRARRKTLRDPADAETSDDDVAAQRAAIDKHRARRNNKKRKQRFKNNREDKDKPEFGGQVTLEPDAEQGKNRFMAEWEAAAEQQGKNDGLRDWWEKVLSYQERTGQPNPDKEFWKMVREEGVIAGKNMALPAGNAIMVDESDDEDGDMAVGKMEGVEKSLDRGISGEMVLRGPRPRLPTVEEERGHQSRSVTPLEPVPRDSSEDSGADLDDEGDVRF
ncbi:MAG: hypothetical protein Q9221_005760 [Calogaya cf. arnoldii]